MAPLPVFAVVDTPRRSGPARRLDRFQPLLLTNRASHLYPSLACHFSHRLIRVSHLPHRLLPALQLQPKHRLFCYPLVCQLLETNY